MSRRPGRPRTSRARLLAGAGSLAVVVALLPAVDRAVGPEDVAGSAALPLLATTDASWTDREHVTTPLVRGARDCARAYRYSSRAGSRMLSGTFLGADLGALMGGAIVTEGIFNIPGVGGLLFRAITQQEAPTVVSLTTVLVIVYIVANLFVDLLYAALDPRIRYA